MTTATYAPVTKEEFESLMPRLRPLTDADAWHKAETALATLKERGMPEPDSYSLSRVTATDDADLNLKVHLAMMPVMRAYLDGELDMDAVQAAVMPLMESVLGLAMEHAFDGQIPYPVTVEVTA